MRIGLHDTAPVRREGTVYALGFLDSNRRDAEIVDVLLLALENDPVAGVRAQAAESLANRLRFTHVKADAGPRAP